MRPVALLFLLAATPALAQPEGGPPQVGVPVEAQISPAARDLPVVERSEGGPPVVIPRHRGGNFLQGSPGRRLPDPLVGPTLGGGPDITITTFEGMGRASGGPFFIPPDVIGDVGPDHYVQAVNGGITIHDRTGTILVGPLRLSVFWQGTGACATEGGDVIVLYDILAQRWLLAQFASGNGYCVAVSRTPDPTGTYALYHFPTGFFPDYPKISAWPGGYFVGINGGSSGNSSVMALNRAAMLDALPAGSVVFTLDRNYLLPADLDGRTPPPLGTPGLFYTFMDQEYWTPQGIPGPDRLELWDLAVDWATPGTATFTLDESLPTAPFNYTVCGFFNFQCAPQPGTGQRLDVVSEWPMWRAAYRNDGGIESLIGSFSVDVTGAGQAGIRWFELRKTGPAWALRQEGTHAPSADFRFMPSAAMNAAGTIAIGYAVSSTTVFPSLRVAVRLAGDPLGQLRDEVVFQAGGGSQTGVDRYGDYFALSVDPADDQAFWFTGEYYPVTSSDGWATRIGKIVVGTGVAAEPIPVSVPTGLTVGAPYPNPVPRGAGAAFAVTVDRPQHVRVEVLDALGRRLAVVFDGALPAGERRLALDAARLPAGLHLIRVRGEFATATRPLVVR